MVSCLGEDAMKKLRVDLTEDERRQLSAVLEARAIDLAARGAMPIDGPERELIARLRSRADELGHMYASERRMLQQAADMIEQMAQRIEVAEQVIEASKRG
jgi:hypothetical protein